ncbi:MAG: hypothetical protein ABI361_09775 [Nitrososphaera sp.]
MQGIQKEKCISCGIGFMSEDGAKMCPTCSMSRGGQGHEMGGCGCGGHHH